MRALNEQKKALNGAKVLVLGVAYKQDIDDYRESPALHVIECLKASGAEVTFYDPYIATYRFEGQTHSGLSELTPEMLQASDLVVITTAHTTVDYDMVAEYAPLIFDTKNAMKGVTKRENIRLL